MKHPKLIALMTGVALIAAACGDDGSVAPAAEPAPAAAPAPDPIPTADPVAVPDPTATPDSPAPEATFPSTIISLSPTATEMLYAIGAGDQVLAVDDFSNFPPEAVAKASGVSAFDPNVEAIAGLEPDLVVTDGTNPGLLEQLDAVGIAHWEGEAATGFEDVYAQVVGLGEVVGREQEANTLAEQLRADVDEALAGVPELREPLTYYHELDSTFFSVSSDTFIGAIYEALGLVNITELAGEDLGFYPQLNAEFIIDSNPDIIFLACTIYCGETGDTVAERPGWDALDALSLRLVFEMDDDIASRWGPRMVEYVGAAAQAVTQAANLKFEYEL
jgi:iron complex transport system substrate-binding protein